MVEYVFMNFSKKFPSAKSSEESSAPWYLEADPRKQYEKYIREVEIGIQTCP